MSRFNKYEKLGDYLKKLIIVINGSGGAGKDTICNIVSKYYPTINISSITPIIEIAKLGGWSGEKDAKSRRLLSDLKSIFTEYNDLSYLYIMRECKKFLEDNNLIMFVHIREANEIQKFKNSVLANCKTLLIRRKETGAVLLGNESDDLVEKFQYDYFYNNNKSLLELENDFMKYFRKILIEQDVISQGSFDCTDQSDC